ncbi:hypothetical protein CF394_12165 [Tetzosporium hominis]|uniref:DUF3784 domain-containing protein n=1 Tax=Tetzosporium hominis TaxID=2020506 RepID=A0A264W143_9BACL|nr:hypothetical protein [Tetzosporium hominis]OZS77302.1 hypothetical protein CF394_12165 [Tetzosporium hominis]
MTNVFLVILLVGFTYGLVKQIKYTIDLKENRNTIKNKRKIIGNIMFTFFYSVFLITYVLNLINLQTLVQYNELILQLCFISVLFALVSKFLITPKRNIQ